MSNALDKVIGYEEIKMEMKIICDTMVNPDKYAKLGVKVPRGILLAGNPGLGKTLMANCFIEESGRASFTIRKDKPDGEFVNYIRETFEYAKEKAPSIVFLDDMDKFANDDDMHRDCEEYVTVQACIDMVKDFDVFVIATVNNRYNLPDSLQRSGRFDRIIEVECPKDDDAEKIMKFYLDQREISDDINVREIARILEDKSCADLEKIVNNAGLYAGYEGRDKINHDDMIRACLREVFEAPEQVDNIETNEDRRKVAVHEAGHAVIAEILDPGSVNVVSIAGHSGDVRGITSISKPKGYWKALELMEHRVIGLLGGKAATEMVYGVVDVGTTSDYRRAIHLARRFVSDYSEIGFDSFDFSNPTDYTLEQKDRYTAVKMEEYYLRAKRIIAENREFVDAIADELMSKNTVTGNRIAEIRRAICGGAA